MGPSEATGRNKKGLFRYAAPKCCTVQQPTDSAGSIHKGKRCRHTHHGPVPDHTWHSVDSGRWQAALNELDFGHELLEVGSPPPAAGGQLPAVGR
jgi:hypothetical protein|mmetsp:Transcript_61401/g.101468  ORF Transcript_61401/g.101468 Transcript_61401/m.101468 type:complete len:95 (+) Transcript_61401:351-635(+)